MPLTLSGETAEVRIAANPDRLIMIVPGLKGNRARRLANTATAMARSRMPKMTGWAASRIYPVYGYGYFGIGFQDSYVWFQENGIRSFTMSSLAGKTIPMWINDPTGSVRQANPKARTRTSLSGIPQVLIFRRAARVGQTRTVTRRSKVSGEVTRTEVPASYPGAPGRIGMREAGTPWTAAGRRGGQIARGNVGVRWRHPGLAPRKFLNRGITLAAQQGGILPVRIYAADRWWRSRF